MERDMDEISDGKNITFQEVKECQEKISNGTGGRNEFHTVVVFYVNNLANADNMSSQSIQQRVSAGCDLILHVSDQEDSLYVDLDSSQGGDAEDQKQSPREQDSFAFTVWVMSHLLRLLPEKIEDESLRSKICVTVTEVLRNVKRKSIYRFTKLLRELISYLSELSVNFPEFFGENPPNQIEVTKYVCSELPQSEEARAQYPHRPTTLKDPESCERLQASISKILLENIVDVSQFCKDVPQNTDAFIGPDILWPTVVSQLRDGEVLLKTVSVELADKLLEHTMDLPRAEMTEFFVGCLVALVGVLVSGHDQCEGDYAALEDALAACLETFLDVTGEEGYEECAVLDVLLKGIMKHVTTHGLRSLRSEKLKSMICDVVVELSDTSEETGVALCILSDARNEMVETLTSELGTETNSQHGVQFFWHCVMEDIEENEMHSSDIDVGDDSLDDIMWDGTETNCTMDGDWEMSETPDLPEDYDKASQTLSGLLDRLEEFMKTLTSKDSNLQLVCQTYEGIRVIIEVIAWSCTSHQTDIGKWISDAIQQRLVASISENLLDLANRELNDETISSIVHKITNIFGGLLLAQDSAGYESDIVSKMVTEMIGILSMHWIQSEMSWSDLKPQNDKTLVFISSAFGDKLDEHVLADSVSVLSLIPKDCAGGWRKHVLVAALGDSRPAVRGGAVKNFPFFLHHLGPNANPLKDVLTNVIDDKDLGVLRSLAEILGPLACVFSRKVKVKMPEGFMHDGMAWQCQEIQCAGCEPEEHFDEELKDRPAVVDPNMFTPFLRLVNSSDETVKLNFVDSLERMFGHIHIRVNDKGEVSSPALFSSMNLLVDGSYDVRVAFSETFAKLLPTYYNDSTVGEKVVSKMREILNDADRLGNDAVCETVLRTAGEVARAATGIIQDNMICVVLVEWICFGNEFVKAVARTQLVETASGMSLSMQAIFRKYNKNLCEVIVKHLHTKQEGTKDCKETMSMLEDIAEFFGYENTRKFLEEVMPIMIPHIVVKASPISRSIVRAIASSYFPEKTHKEMMVDHLKYIYCYLTLHHSVREVTPILNHLADDAQLKIGQLLSTGSDLDINLIMHLGQNHDRVVEGLKWLRLYMDNDDRYNRNVANIKMAELVRSLEDKMLGMLLNIDKQLNNPDVCTDDKRKTYESLIAIMKLMGKKNVTTVRMRIISILRSCQEKVLQSHPKLCVEAWEMLVESVDISCLGSMLSQIAVSLLPLFKLLPDQVAQIYRFLIVDNRNKLESYFEDLYFLPDKPELTDVNKVIKAKSQKRRQGLEEKLALVTNGITHESMDVRKEALTELKSLLHDNQKELHSLVVKEERVHPVVATLINMLLDGCHRVSNPEIKGLYGKCLGELGAIDPSRLESLSGKMDDLRNFFPFITDTNMAASLINKLANAFLRANDKDTVGCVSYALQTLIQHFGIEISRTSDSFGAKLYRNLSPEIQDILTPLMTSKYTMTYKVDWSTVEKPIYQSKKGRSFNEWIKNFAAYLISKVHGEDVETIFRACSATVKMEHHVALYLLPYIVMQILLDGTDGDRNDIRQEMLAVLNHAKEAEGRHGGVSDLRHMCAQTVFSLLDHLTKFTRYRVKVLASMAYQTRSRATMDQYRVEDDKSYVIVKQFLNEIPQDLLAAASLNCGAYTRALRHLEHYIQSTTNLQGQLDVLQKLYVLLDEPDGVAGVTAVNQGQARLEEKILAYESTGQLSDASACYDKIIIQQPEELKHRQNQLACRLSMGELDTTLMSCNGIISERREWGSALNQYRVEAAWKLGDWSSLENYLEHEEHSRNWNIGVGKSLLAAKKEDNETFRQQIDLLRSLQMGPLSAASMEIGSYYRGYEHIIRLHMLNELERGLGTLLDTTRMVPETSADTSFSFQHDVSYLQELRSQWDTRLTFVQTSYKTQEPILSLRRAILNHIIEASGPRELRRDIGQCWLESAKLARESGQFQTAHSSLISASVYKLPEYDIELAKLLWERGKSETAISSLEKALAPDFQTKSRSPEISVNLPEEKRIVYARMLLLLGTYREETSSMETNEIIKQYKKVTELHPDWEDGWFILGQYYDKVMRTLKEDENQPEQRGNFIMNVVHNFGRSLQYGNQYIYQSMSRMLTLWLDYGARVSELETEYANRERKQNLTFSMATIRNCAQKLNKEMQEFGASLASYQFLTAFPQLISRICMTHPETFKVMSEIIKRVLQDFPQQAMWQMMAVSKSSVNTRSDRCRKIFQSAPEKSEDGPKLRQFLQDATRLTEQLLIVCNKTVPGSTASVAKHFSKLQNLIKSKNFSDILIPLQSLMTVTLPPGEGLPSNHDPFPGRQVFIQSIEDTVEILPSLQRPKKITLVGSDGNLYMMMCKPKDDLRKDARLMEFNSIINKCLRKDPEARRRDLHIRTYIVTPLNEECGLLEWVNNTSGLRNIILRLYKERHISVSGQELKAMGLPPNAAHEKKLDVYRNKLLPRHPALFGEWFLNTFPDPTSWYNARLNYCRTSAVMCMVGYILGLGDRHGENILFDSTNGDCVHVDFNCLFNKGMEFEYPEVVPFRMTHNLVKAMGPLKCEGVFRKSCEVTMRVVRNQIGPLMSVLNTFVYDPLVEWSKSTKGKSSQNSGIAKNKAASERVGDIEARMKGILNKKKGLPLSVEGHVNQLIREATDENNLARMYIGWAAYM